MCLHPLHQPDDVGSVKDRFKDMMQEMLDAEMDISIGYPKGEKYELINVIDFLFIYKYYYGNTDMLYILNV